MQMFTLLFTLPLWDILCKIIHNCFNNPADAQTEAKTSLLQQKVPNNKYYVQKCATVQ